MQRQEAFKELERSVYCALETYSNVHRGSGYNSIVTTHLYEKARSIVLDYLDLKSRKYEVIFCNQRSANLLTGKLKSDRFHCISSQKFGLLLGVVALAVDRKSLPGGAPLQSGGGTTTIISPEWIVWAGTPDKFEAGTPAIINVIAFAKALTLIQKYGEKIFLNSGNDDMSVNEIIHNDEMMKYSGKKLLDELRMTLIGRNVIVPTSNGNKYYINLDNSASTPALMPVWNTVRKTWYQSLQTRKDIISEVRNICAEMIGAPLANYDLLFTSNTTEAINLASESLSRETLQDTEPVVLSTLLEHSSNDLPWRMIWQQPLIKLKIDKEGFLDLNELDSVLSEYNDKKQHGKKRIRLLTVSGASNVLGTVNNLEEISRIVHKYGARLLVDAAQLVAHRKIEMEKWGIDYLAFSAHKVYAPFGTGVLVIRKGLLNFSTADLEQIHSSGEENLVGIAALGKSFLLLQKVGMNIIQDEELDLTRRILDGFAQIEGLKVYGISDPSSPRLDQKGGVIVFTLKGFMSDKVAKELSERGGIGIRYGCHCAHILVKHILGVSPGLERFQRIIARLFTRLRFPGVARVSLGIGNSDEHIDTLIQVLKQISVVSGHSREKKLKRPQAKVKEQINDLVRAAELSVYSDR